MSTSLEFNVNGEAVQLEVEDDETLQDVLRKRLGLTGTKSGCGEGQCGHCTVILNAKSVNSCLTLALEAQGADCLTIEGLGKEKRLHPVQQSFVDIGAVQCGYCTPGMIMSAVDLLNHSLDPSDDDIREGVKGVMCRCTGYYKIIEAVKQAAASMRQEAAGDE
jgi:aerobic-type carbon monoxide dehydrogenase small subunit (CoxS/CutS family)